MKSGILNAAIGLVLVTATLPCMSGCDKQSTGPDTQTASTTNATTAPASTEAQPAAPPQAQPQTAIADSDLVTPADFEEDAEKSITGKSYKNELAVLEKDIAKD
jgi:hypothetical protein